MKQKYASSHHDLFQLETTKSKTSRQKQSKDKPINSPRLITRKQQSRQVLHNPFARRNNKKQQITVLRYLSPKRENIEESKSFISDESSSHTFNEHQFQKSMFDLNFSRINKSQLPQNMNEISQTKNLFDDLLSNNEQQAQNCQKTIQYKKCKNNLNKFDILQKNARCHKQQKSQISLETMPQSPQQKNNHKFDNFESQNSYLGQNQFLIKQNNQLRNLLTFLKEENQQLRFKVMQNENDINKIQSNHQQKMTLSENRNKSQRTKINLQLFLQVKQIQELKQTLTKKQSEFQSIRVQNLQKSFQIQQKNQIIQQLQYRTNNLTNQVTQLEGQISQIRNQLKYKIQYGKCLQDVIFQLNQKIYFLKKQNQLKEDIVDLKNDQLLQKQQVIEQKSSQIQLYIIQISSNRDKIEELSLELQNQQKKSIWQIKSTTGNQQFSDLIITTSLHQQTETDICVNKMTIFLEQQVEHLYSVVKQQKLQNQKLKKQICYMEIQLNLLKKKSYNEQKDKKQIQNLKTKNKTALKKINQLMELNYDLKEKNMKFGETFQNKPSKQDKKRRNSHQISQNINVDKDSNLKNQTSSKTTGSLKLLQFKRKTQSFHPSNQNIDSDEELSFNLSR